jgi:hypothetical protein
MANKIDIDFVKYSGMDIVAAHRVLMKKGITTSELEELATKLCDDMSKYVENRNMNDEYKILLDLVMTYYLFSTGLMSYNDWIKKEAAEHNLKPEKYIKVIFGL